MAHKKGQGSSRNGRDSNSKRRGIKEYGGEAVLAGYILARQCGTKWHAGVNVGIGRDYTLFATADGTVYFDQRGRRMNVRPHDDDEHPYTPPRSCFRSRKKKHRSKSVKLNAGQPGLGCTNSTLRHKKPSPLQLGERLGDRAVRKLVMVTQDANFDHVKLVAQGDEERSLVDWFFWHSDLTVTAEWRTSYSAVDCLTKLAMSPLAKPPWGVVFDLEDSVDKSLINGGVLVENNCIQVIFQEQHQFDAAAYITEECGLSVDSIQSACWESAQCRVSLCTEGGVTEVSAQFLPLDDGRSVANSLLEFLPVSGVKNLVKESIISFVLKQCDESNQKMRTELGHLE